MTTAEGESTLSPTPPSPGPVLPGAWPSSLHRRSTTCPTRPVVDALNLDRVFDFQQRLVNRMEQSEPSSTSLSASASVDSALTPADSLDSELTRFRDTSVSTTYTSRSSPERFVTAKLPQLAFKTKYSAVENNYPTRIPRSTFSRSTFDQTRARTDNVVSAETPSPPRFLSPIIFASPASSSFPRFMAKPQPPSPRNRSSSYEYNSSPSWETSYGSEYNDRHMLNPSPSPSPMSGRPNSATNMSCTNRTPSIEIGATVPMLTSLSLPASPDTSMSLDMDPVASRSPRLSPIDGDTSPWSLSLSPASPVLSVIPDLSLSSPAPGNVDHVVSFPSPSLSASPSASPLSSPVLDGALESEYVYDTSAAEYAAAVMSSAWASDAPSMAQVIPRGLLSTENDTTSLADEDAAPDPNPSLDVTLEEQQLPEPLAYLDNIQYLPTRRQEGKMSGVLGKMKKLGDKVKKLLRGKPKTLGNGGVNIDVDVRRVGGVGNSPVPYALPDVIDIHSPTAVAQVYDSLLPSHGTESHLPLPLPPPPGLGVRKPKARPILSSQTYRSTLARTRTNDNAVGQNPPTIRIRPPSSSGHVAASINPPSNTRVTPKTPSPDLTAHSRPKTLAEIKSKRRLSLSTLSNFTRSSSPAPPINVVTSNHHRRRPSSALAFYPRPPPISSFRTAAQTDGSETTYRRPEVPASTSSRTISTAAVSGTVRSVSVPASMALHADNPLPTDAMKRKNRRFSLSALSNFAAGHWDEGSWQKNGTVHMPRGE
ncbi:hypothetical protein B0H17DRAFT_1035803 [Mycena rosella]|uniref:Uncharacterized protein n=1 Tax=Mycena rosella TaxID=1033263 RepID=A0AAD7GV66_MYCRO|nr:hypothetical protein B0H17DRAFT_1035803 [Mycena rosella]